MKKSEFIKKQKLVELPTKGDLFSIGSLSLVIKELGCADDKIKFVNNKKLVKNSSFQSKRKKMFLDEIEIDIDSVIEEFINDDIEILLSI